MIKISTYRDTMMNESYKTISQTKPSKTGLNLICLWTYVSDYMLKVGKETYSTSTKR